MLQINWKYRIDIKTANDLIKMLQIFKKIKPDYSGLDTETDGLHIIYSKPFLYSFGFYNSETLEGATFTYDFEYSTLDKDSFFYALYKVLEKTKKTSIHNAKFDKHQSTNAEHSIPSNISVTDTMFYIRLAHDNVSTKDGGPKLGLKDYASKYIDTKAKNFEGKLTSEKTELATRYNNQLVKRFKKFTTPDEKYHPKGTTPKSWTKGVLNKFFKDILNEPEDLPDQEMINEYYAWKNNLPKALQNRLEKNLVTKNSIPYNMLNRDNVTEYAHYDIIYMLEIFHKTKDIITLRKQEETLKLEEDLIQPLYEMERVGFKFNLPYALESKAKVKQYILEKRERLQQLAGQSITIGQHKLLKEIIENEFDLDLDGTGNDKLNEVLYETNDEDAIEFINIIIELRSLEKWYSTYIIKWIESAQINRRVYTTINQVGAVSGRVSSDFQQFPGKALYDSEGNELFNPRQLIMVTGEDYPVTAYLDYSQVELRFQALYTIFVSGGDRNLCRAYMPFECHHYITKEPFNYNSEDHLKRWDEMKPNHPDPKDYKDGVTDVLKLGWSIWVHDEDNQPWHPIDLHTKTTTEAFPNVPVNSNEFKPLRKQGKSTNFACTYGANQNTLEKQFKYAKQIAQALYNGYRKAFPKIQDYRNYVYKFLMTSPYLEGLFGRKYYGISAHKGANYLIQGSSADFLKMKIIEVTKFLKENNLKSRFQMNIHDEMSFEIHKDELYIIPKLKEIMENLPGTKVPIIADIEITFTTWDKKEGFTNDITIS